MATCKSFCSASAGLWVCFRTPSEGRGPPPASCSNRWTQERRAAPTTCLSPKTVVLLRRCCRSPERPRASAGPFFDEPRGSVGFRQVLRDEIPIHQMITESLHEIRAPVLEVEIIRVFPHVAGQERGLALGQRIDRVWCGGDLELSAVGDKPCPATAELTDRRRLELLFELFEAAAITVDRLRDLPARRAATARLHRVPEEGVVPHLGGVVEHAGL